MSTHIVVCFRWSSLELSSAEQVVEARALTQQAAALGGSLLGVGSLEILFGFQESDLDEAVELVARGVLDAAQEGLSRAGVSRGETHALDPGGEDAFVRLSWGEPILAAAALARTADPRQVLVDERLAMESARVGVMDVPAREVRLGGTIVRGRVLSLQNPLVEAGPSEPDRGPPQLAETDEYTRARGWEAVELAREALQRGDEQSLSLAIQALEAKGGHVDLVQRLVGVLALSRGAREDGLRILRRAAEAEQHPGARARAILAYAVAVAAAGRQEDALLEGLSALAATRALGDLRGELACARFLSRLAQGASQPEAASAWEHVARRCEAALAR
jgi:hypothetical protein